MKIAVTGKGGVGKTSFAATLDRIYAKILVLRYLLNSSNFPAAFGAYDLAEIGEICINVFGAIEKLF